MFGDIAIEGAHLSDLAADADSGMTDLMLALPGAISPRYVDRRFTRRDGTRLQIQVRASDLRDDPTVAGLVLTIRDVTSQRQLEAQLKHQAFHDSLTGLPNRVLFQDRIGHEIAVVRRDGGIAAVMFVDLDDFKVVNDTLGHAVGDELLVAIAERLSGLIRASDTTARLGGDEFALLIAGAENMAAVETTAGRVVNAFADPFQLTSRQLLMSVTVGLATTMDSTDSDELLRYADLALYAAKAAGKRQWRRYQPVLSAGIIRRREVQAALEDAVARSAFTIVYQPIVDLATDEIAGFEALVRWPHEQWGMLKPDQFIAIAEETGQIVPLGAWVLQQALEVVTGWRRDLDRAGAPGRRPYVSVNVSARQFEVNGFVEEVRRMVVSMGLPPGALMLELTESVMLGPDERVHSELFKLKSMGVRLAIDDFGTGYSSLSYLRELPIDVLKIDKSFIDGMTVSSQQLALVEGIIGIAKKLDLDVTAEGIETDAQREMLIAMGCHYGQGYLLAMPADAEQTEALIRERRPLTTELPG
jgi:diguanylate cyclase (GGDEF)-like protein